MTLDPLTRCHRSDEIPLAGSAAALLSLGCTLLLASIAGCVGVPLFTGTDLDGDGIPPDEDCDNLDPSTVNDMDCDGVVSSEDCDDNDPSTINDMDCDGVPTESDCDDRSSDFGDVANDADCDGVVSSEDCDDSDPTTIHDMDCDGVPTDEDCDDSDPNDPIVCGVDVEAGSFTMGCTASTELDCSDDNLPQHVVSLSHGFWIGETEVTQGDWQDLMGNSPSSFSSCGSACPVESVSWHEAVAFANAASAAEGLPSCYSLDDCTGTAGNNLECVGATVVTSTGSVYDCQGYRLPTEAEWEYAARAGTNSTYSGSDDAEVVAWFNNNSGEQTHPVATREPNAWGLYDMSGNVYEWVSDAYGESYYDDSPSTDPGGPTGGSLRVCRGGSATFYLSALRVYNRSRQGPGFRGSGHGFRLARTEQ